MRIWRPNDPDAPISVTWFDEDGITILKQEEVLYGGSATPPAYTSPTGYAFDNWYTTLSGNTVANYNYVTKTSEFYARNRIKTYVITYYDKDDVQINTQTINHGDDATALTPPTVDGYSFVGWYNSSARTTATSFTNITTNRKAYAKYDEVVETTWDNLQYATWNDIPDGTKWEDL